MFLWAPKRRSRERKNTLAGRIDQHKPLQIQHYPTKMAHIKECHLIRKHIERMTRQRSLNNSISGRYYPIRWAFITKQKISAYWDDKISSMCAHLDLQS